MNGHEEVELTMWATSWVDQWVEEEVEERDGREVVLASEVQEERRLVVIAAASPEEARRESGLIDHEFTQATEEELEEWGEISRRSLSEGDVEMLVRLLAKEQRQLSRTRAKDYAAARGLTTRGLNSFVLTPAGLAELRERSIAARGNDPAPLIDALVRGGLPRNDRNPDTLDHFRARVFTELRGKLIALGEEDR